MSVAYIEGSRHTRNLFVISLTTRCMDSIRVSVEWIRALIIGLLVAILIGAIVGGAEQAI